MFIKILTALISLGKIADLVKAAWAKVQATLQSRKDKKRAVVVRELEIEREKPIQEMDDEVLRKLHARLRRLD